ncbi:hypothetical protein BJV82DRAFT_593737 [Fennellomyces sp. T-0311]|nr:hypothetical protein BJV82DRAFT_593737 [Fennellomyces sp. T-0311]
MLIVIAYTFVLPDAVILLPVPCPQKYDSWSLTVTDRIKRCRTHCYQINCKPVLSMNVVNARDSVSSFAFVHA